MIRVVLRPSCLERQKKLYFQQLLLPPLLPPPPSIHHHRHLLHNQIQDQYSLLEMQQCLFAIQGLQF